MSLYYPSLNPIVLSTKACDGYAQPFELGDRTAIVLVEDSTDASTLTVSLRSEYGVAKAYALSRSFTLDGFRFSVYSIDFQGIEAGTYYLSVLVQTREETAVNSLPLCLKEAQNETVTILASNTDNIQDIPFEEGISLFYRVQGGFFDKSLSPKSDDASYQNEDADFVLLSSVPYESYKLNVGGTGGIPDYVQRIFNRVFALDTLLINGEPFTKLEGAEWSPIEEDEYSFRSWELEVVRTENFDSELVAEYLDTAYWSDYLCQLQSTPLAYVFLFTENQGTTLEQEVQNVGGAVRIGITSLQAELPYGSITVNNLPTWATLTKDGSDFILTLGDNPTDARTQAITFVQGESGKAITLQLTQRGSEVFDPFVATVDDGATTAVIGGNTYLSAT